MIVLVEIHVVVNSSERSEVFNFFLFVFISLAFQRKLVSSLDSFFVALRIFVNLGTNMLLMGINKIVGLLSISILRFVDLANIIREFEIS